MSFLIGVLVGIVLAAAIIRLSWILGRQAAERALNKSKDDNNNK